MSDSQDRMVAAIEELKRQCPSGVKMINHDTYKNLFDPDGYKAAKAKLLMWGLGLPDMVRLKDAWVETNAEGAPEFVFYARCVSRDHTCSCRQPDHSDGFSEMYGDCWAYRMRDVWTHPLYLRFEEDSPDSDYAKYFFAAIPGSEEDLRLLAVEPVNMAERWKTALAAIQLDPSPSGADEIREAISDLLPPQ